MRNKFYLVILIGAMFSSAIYSNNLKFDNILYSGQELNFFVDVLEDAEALLVHKDIDTIGRLCHMIRGISRLTKNVVFKTGFSELEKIKIAHDIDNFKEIIIRLKKDSKDGELEEQQKMAAGLTAILYNVVSIMVSPEKIGTYLLNILSGLGKIVSSILADGKINSDDWSRLMRAFGSIFSISNLYGLLGTGK
jgi:hypothetical protein